jgi:myo-inositol 2-dehydrogenase/D-chiro-inositol 1-dehydrogenase
MDRDSLGIGVIGTGGMGSRHAANIHEHAPGAHVTGVFDIDQARASTVAAQCGGARVYASPHDLISDGAVDAVLIASPDETHVAYTLACLDKGKPVLCEKPMALGAAEAREVVEAEIRLGRRMVTVGFMRRFDHQHVVVKATVASGRIGRPYLYKGVHRNQRVPHDFTCQRIIAGSAIHDIDATRWLLEREVEQVYVRGVHVDPTVDPDTLDLIVMILSLGDDTLSAIEVYVSAQYGYEVTAEVVGDRGTVTTQQPGWALLRSENVRGAAVPRDWLDRFADAYIAEVKRWVRSLRGGSPAGPNAWDGYASLLVADACIASMNSGQQVSVSVPDRPDLYAS